MACANFKGLNKSIHFKFRKSVGQMVSSFSEMKHLQHLALILKNAVLKFPPSKEANA